MRHHLICALTLSLSAALPAFGQSLTAQREACDNLRGDKSPAAVVTACTATIAGGGSVQVRAGAYHNRGAAFRAQGDFAKAIADYNESLRLNPRDANTFYVRGNAYASQRDYVHAIADYTDAIRLDPELAQAFNNRGGAYHDQHDYVRAIADFDQALKLDEDYAAALTNRCAARAALGRELDLAQADCNKSLSLRPNHPATLDIRGLVNLLKRDFKHAFTDYDAAYQLDREQFGSLYGRGIAQLRLGRTDAGRADIALANTRDPAVAGLFAQSGVTP